MSSQSPSLTPFIVPNPPGPAFWRATLSPEAFRARLRRHMLDHPSLTLAQVAEELGRTRQRISSFVGKLNRSNCAQPGPRLSPKRDEAARRMLELELRVQNGESAESAAKELGISLNQAAQLGFKSRAIRSPAHGSGNRRGCNCWRCRKAKGIVLPRGPKTPVGKTAAILDWCAWRDPDDGRALTQQEVARLCGVVQPVVSRIAKGAAQ